MDEEGTRNTMDQSEKFIMTKNFQEFGGDRALVAEGHKGGNLAAVAITTYSSQAMKGPARVGEDQEGATKTLGRTRPRHSPHMEYLA